jgi:hypothetical protein
MCGMQLLERMQWWQWLSCQSSNAFRVGFVRVPSVGLLGLTSNTEIFESHKGSSSVVENRMVADVNRTEHIVRFDSWRQKPKSNRVFDSDREPRKQLP